MHRNQDAPVVFGRKRNRLDARIDFAPLFAPVGAHLGGAAHETAFKGFGPRHVRRHSGESGVDVARVEGGVSRAQQFDLGRRVLEHEIAV